MHTVNEVRTDFLITVDKLPLLSVTGSIISRFRYPHLASSTDKHARGHHKDSAAAVFDLKYCSVSIRSTSRELTEPRTQRRFHPLLGPSVGHILDISAVVL